MVGIGSNGYRNGGSMKRGTVMAVMMLASATVNMAAGATPLQGDEAAVLLAERMLETLGGRDMWAQARSIKVELRGWYAREQEPWDEVYWMSLEVPRGRFELSGETTDRVVAWTPDGGWQTDSGELTTMPDDEHSFELAYWRLQPAVVFHRLAVGGPATRVAPGDNEYRFDVFETESGELVAQFAVNRKGEPIKWGASIGEREFEHVFGPLASFGDLRMPRWGATLAGIWRYEHSAVELSRKPVSVSLEKPDH
jgi:hypothetical protein